MLDLFGGEEKEKKDQLISILLFNCVKNIDQETAEKVFKIYFIWSKMLNSNLKLFCLIYLVWKNRKWFD